MVPENVQEATKSLLKAWTVIAVLNVDWLNNGVDTSGNKKAVVQFIDGTETNYLKFVDYVLSLYKTEEQPRTTNMNFWEAYQAMNCGEWVCFEGCSYAEHFKMDGNVFKFFLTDGKRYESTEIDTGYLDTRNWYVVPKSPSYKIGDRFEESFATGAIRILQIEYVMNNKHDGLWWYAVAICSTSGSLIRYDIVGEKHLKQIRQLPS